MAINHGGVTPLGKALLSVVVAAVLGVGFYFWANRPKQESSPKQDVPAVSQPKVEQQEQSIPPTSTQVTRPPEPTKSQGSSDQWDQLKHQTSKGK